VVTSRASRPSIFVSSSRFELPILIGALGAANVPADRVRVVRNESGNRLSQAELVAQRPEHCVGVIAGLEPFTAEVFAHYPDLRVVARLGTGTDTVDVDAAARRGITVLTTPDATTDAVAELAVGLMLASLRGISTADRRLRAGEWKPHLGGLLRGRVVGIIGFGRIGRRVAELVGAFGARVTFFDPLHDRNDPRRVDSLGSLVATSDIVTLHAPLAEATRHMIDAAVLAGMKPGALLVNAARGELVDEAALLAALREKRISAAVDCYATEPYSGPLRECDNVVLTAHMGSLTAETRAEMEQAAANELVAELVRLRLL
jgi:D-3-phosphoglycerate dehydrogenase